MNGETVDHDHLLIEARNTFKSIVELLTSAMVMWMPRPAARA
jgi:hypothetical protein